MLRDLRFALHLIAKDRWYSAVAIIALALGTGVNATVFTLVNAVLIRSLPFPDAGRLFVLSSDLQGVATGVSFADLDDWRTQTRSFTGLAGFNVATANLSDEMALPQQVRSASITSNMFSLVGQQPLAGRDFAPGDDRAGAAPVALIGYTLWQTRYAGELSILGRSIRINAQPYTVVGVMPHGMEFPSNTEVWLPAVRTADVAPRNIRSLAVIARLRPEVSISQAQTEMNGVAARLASAYPDTNKDYSKVHIETFQQRFNGDQVRPVFLSMMGAVGFVLLIACANVANLLLSRSVKRTREIAVRIALGATRWRVMRQLLIESVLLGFMGGAVGLGLAVVGVRLFDNATANTGKPYWIVFSMDYTVFGFLAIICLVTGILFGLAPALQVTKANVHDVLKEGGRGNAGARRASWITGMMVVLELALTLVLLVGAGLMVRSFLKLYTLDGGINPDHLLAMDIRLPATKYPTPEARRAFFDRLAPRVAATPGAQSVALTTSVPPFNAARRRFEIEGHVADATAMQSAQAAVVTISPDFFGAAGVQLRRGRLFTQNDGAPGADNVIVNERFASLFLKGEDPIGRRVRLAAAPARPGAPSAPQPWRTIVGVSPTLRHSSFQEADPVPAIYTPYRQDAPANMTMLVRSYTEPRVVLKSVQSEVQAIDADQPVFTVRTMDEMLAQQTWPYRVFGAVFAIFAGIALVMATVGLYAVMAYSVVQRTAEIGVRMALGADGRRVSWMILRRGLVQLALGLTLGLAGAVGLSRVIQALLVQVSPTDPLTFISITVFLSVVAIAACLLPARRATRVDPLIALRAE
ncbi:MAG TPA: ABC transporter permease [Vicinamibacterales bacterium]|jgi:putative ABC transport system permease protein|nr:ABC transporter permease [Vicinamibacterales bacterium]